MINDVHETYGNRLRVRACGICIVDEKILLINHKYLTKTDFWSPPGGGIEFGESAAACIVREFKEETGLDVRVGDFLFACEFIHLPLHGIELFFRVYSMGGNLQIGHDPETNSEKQIISHVKFTSWNEIKTVKPETLHGAFSLVDEPVKITDLRGYFKI